MHPEREQIGMAPENQSTDIVVARQEGSASWSRRLSITVPRERVARTRRSVATQIARNVRLPGFRKGKLPESLIEKQFGRAIDDETRDRLIQEAYREALDHEGLQPINQGQVVDVRWEAGSDFVFDVEFEVRPELNLARTGGFVVPRPAEEVGEEEVDAVLERLRADRATLHAVDDRKPDYGDEVTVEITSLDTEGAEPQPYRFALGEGQAIPDIEAAILSLDPGTEGEFGARFPDDFPDEEQRGKEERLRIRLSEVRRRELPALDDELAQSLGEFDTLDALRARIREDLRAESARRAEGAVRDALVGQIVEANPIDVPESMVDRYLEYMTGQGDEEKRPARTPEQEEQFAAFRQMLRPQAEAALKRMLVVEHLADREQLRATQDEVDARVEQLAERYGRSPSDVWLEMEKTGQLQGLESEITEEKVFDWLRRQSNVG
jgi:trigger factor